ncbi:hypothetical protein L1987_09677 [Smallanthus sonchifolius]|uniref:Uncharacterized protein n=1 Tax=Smallanthus sonchifolius TaxID=185202 RepID=A0ACB9JQ16_9ASTR|nr:hypothetical protein L1987_09677 [Smallanthus sonchifolius]
MGPNSTNSDLLSLIFMTQSAMFSDACSDECDGSATRVRSGFESPGGDAAARSLPRPAQGEDNKAAVNESIVVGGGCTLLRLASKVDAIKETLDNDEEKVSISFA